MIKRKGKNYSNTDIAEYLTNVATAYEIKKKNYFRIVSYQNASESIISLPYHLYTEWQKDKSILNSIPGIGANIQKKLTYLFENGRPHPHNARAFKGIHPAVFAFTKINGIGPKNAHKLTKHIKFSKIPLTAYNQLIKAAESGKIRSIPTFGEKSESLILENSLAFLGHHQRLSLDQANTIAKELIVYLKTKFPEVEFVPLGSLRRQSQTIGDIDIAAKSPIATQILEYFIDYPQNIQTIVKGPKKASIRIKGEVRIDIMVQPAKTWGSLLQHFTGSRQHNIMLRKYAQNLGYSLSEYGIKDVRNNKTITFDNEVDFYNFLKLCYIPPEQRLGEHEIDIAQKCYNGKVKNNSKP